MSAHTPGPWSAPYWDSNPGDRGWWIHNGKQGAEEYAVAVTFSLNPQGEADARLIAAAPDLLEALQFFVAPFAGLEVVPDGFIAKARTAIAKAKGEPHA